MQANGSNQYLRWAVQRIFDWLSCHLEGELASPPCGGTFMRLGPPGQAAIQMNGNHTTSINPLTPGSLRPVSHKV